MAKKKKKSWLNKLMHRGFGAILCCGAVFLLSSVMFFHAGDNALNVSTAENVRNFLGSCGAKAADFTLSSFGLALVLFLIVPVVWGYHELRLREFINPYTRIFAWFSGIVALAAVLSGIPVGWLGFRAGGVGGEMVMGLLMTFVRDVYPYPYAEALVALVLALFALLCFDYATGITWKDWWKWSRAFYLKVSHVMAVWCVYSYRGLYYVWRVVRRLKPAGRAEDEAEIPADEETAEEASVKKTKKVKARKEPKFGAEEKNAPKAAAKAPPVPAKKSKAADDGYQYPDINLLSRPADKGGNKMSEKEMDSVARELEGVLEEFGVRGKIVKVRPGPVVTLYELEPAPGTKTARVIGLADDIARSMSAVSVRIAVVPGSNTIGIELPNKNRETVWLRDLFEDENFQVSKNELNVVLGKDIGGRNVYADLTKMPHLLVAGTTGSGKSVGVNSMILSLLFKMRPDECKLIMIDPKMLEFSMYNGIPHLLTPVITDPAKAVVGLKWAVREMEERYRAMAQINVRNIMGYNQKLKELKASGEVIKRTVQTGFDAETGKPIYEEQELDLTPLPYIVIVVDEMADLMLVAGKEVEAAIQRLAQMARAAGLHLIMSTQRPSVDVITGTIKANFPTRISFQVTSKIDSRTILGEQGAEQLLGRGDMLYMPAGQRPQRIHGAFVKDSEVEQIVEFIKSQKEPEYVEGVTEGELSSDKSSGGAVFDKGDMGGGNSDEDLYTQAVEIVRNDKKASISYVQRRLRIGYNRAATLIDRMEQEGVISAPDHLGRREVL